MTSKEFKKYVGEKISFDIDDAAYLPLPKIEGEDLRDNNHHLEGLLFYIVGGPYCRSRFGLIVQYEHCVTTIGIRDEDIPYIENFKVLENKDEK